MKDREKQIEEIAKLDIEESAGFYSAYLNDMRISKNKPLSTSKTVMSLNCPKKYILQAISIPEDSVMLSKEEYELLTNDLDKHDYGEFESGYSQGSKETAEKILQAIKELFDSAGQVCDNPYIREPIWGYDTQQLDKGLNILAKQFGVEIKE